MYVCFTIIILKNSTNEEKMPISGYEVIKNKKCIKRSSVNSQKSHSFLTLIHRESISRAVNCHVAVALNRLEKWQQIPRVLDEREEIIKVLIFVLKLKFI